MNGSESLASKYGRSEAPLGAYGVITVIFIGVFVFLFWLARRLGIDLPDRIGIVDMIILGVATHKVSWLIATDVVTSFIRAPFTEYKGMPGPGAATKESPRGKGLRFAVGELLTCPWCVGQWVAALFVFGLLFYPKPTMLVAAIFAVLMLADFLQILYINAGKTLRSGSEHSH